MTRLGFPHFELQVGFLYPWQLLPDWLSQNQVVQLTVWGRRQLEERY